MRLHLLINGQEAELSKDALVLLTYQSADAEKPAAVKNSYSQGVVLPHTPTNDGIFGHLLRSDFRAGTAFNPLARTPFEIRNDLQEVIVSGYLKLNTASGDKGYDVTLYGGLGGFIYALMYKADGTKRTLADMEWNTWNSGWVTPDDETFSTTPQGLAYRYNDGLNEQDCYAFAPFDEGIPEEGFDADKQVKVGLDWNSSDILTRVMVEGKTYYPKGYPSDNTVQINFSGKHSSWEMQEFRMQQQRPLWSIRAFLEAISQDFNNGGYEVYIDPLFEESPFVRKGWVTCKLGWDKYATSQSSSSLADILRDTKSPAEYLLSIAKICGLMFVFDEGRRRVRILTRNTYYGEYSGRYLSLEGRIAEDRGKTVTPLNFSARKILMASKEGYGARLKEYEDRTGRQYGSLRLNTGYPFGDEENDIFSDCVFRDAAVVYASNLGFRFTIGGLVTKQRYTDTVKYTLYTQADAQGNQTSREFEPSTEFPEYPWEWKQYPYNSNYEHGNVCPLVQLCDKDGKTEDGSDVIVFYEYEQDFPRNLVFRATSDHMQEFENVAKPCWVRDAGVQVSRFPLFSRWYNPEPEEDERWGGHFTRPMEFFKPDYGPVNDVPVAKYQGERCWAKWIEERCSADARRMKCWVNLRDAGLPPVNADLLRYFWHYDGAIWVLDKITAHSLATDDLTECEFIKVVDIDNYTNGQDFNKGED